MANKPPLQPYLLIAYYEWMLDNDWTPQILVDSSHPSVNIPQQFANDGQIVLNISPSAVGNYHMDHEAISFDGRFSGASMSIYVPMNAIVAIYARDNDQGIMFSPNMYGDEAVTEMPTGIVEVADDSSDSRSDDSDPNDEPPKPPKGKPFLKVVK